jgi:flagellar hook-associated protein 2
VASVSVGQGAVEGSYSLLVSDAGAYSTMLTDTWNDPGGAPHTFKLSIGAGESYDITPTDNSASAVAAAINSAHSDEVHATVVNVGSTAVPDYRLSLQSAKLTSDLLDLSDGATSLQSVQTAGKPVQYEVNGSGKTVSSDTRALDLADGVSVNILASADDPVQITVTRSNSSLANTMTGFVSAYNAAVSELRAQHGQTGGALQGQSIVTQLSQVLSNIATYSGSGKINGLSALGVSLGSDGVMTFDSSVLLSADPTEFTDISKFFGSTTGGGILKNATDALASILDTDTGVLPISQSSVDGQITSIDSSIADKQTMVDALQTRLESQMAAADALVASMQQQATYMSNMFQAMQNQNNK